MKSLIVCCASLILLSSPVVSQQNPDSQTNLIDIASGTVLVSASSEYGGSWSALNLDYGSGKGWCSADKASLPHTLIFELAQAYNISKVTVDASGDQESGYPGISVKSVSVYGSTESADKGYTELATFDVPRAGRKEVTLSAPHAAAWLKYVVNSNWGNAEYTEIMKVEAYGLPAGPPPQVNVAGIYQTNYGPMRIVQEGNSIAGCYDLGGGEISGNLHGRILQFEWRQKPKRKGPAIMVISLKGDTLSGAWYENGSLGGGWSGKLGGQPPSCTVAAGGIAVELASSGEVNLYGIYFDSDSATPKPESEKTLNEILEALKAQPSLKLLIAGHTDSTSTAAHNLTLSQQRAEAVVSWLVGHGIAAQRLSAKGFGQTQPVADNSTAAGRALNRRVELVKQ
jgi:outer membrane protein OmpA-like peptidoglycan-associated protein